MVEENEGDIPKSGYPSETYPQVDSGGYPSPQGGYPAAGHPQGSGGHPQGSAGHPQGGPVVGGYPQGGYDQGETTISLQNSANTVITIQPNTVITNQPTAGIKVFG